MNKFKNLSLSGNQLKMIAAVAMTCDHAGKALFPDAELLQIIGRISFPIFAYMIAEGCIHTKNRKRYLATLALLAFIFQVFEYIFENSLYMCIFVTFTLSVTLIHTVENAYKKKNFKSTVLAVLTALAVILLTLIIPKLSLKSGFDVDYGFFGVLLPCMIYVCNGKIPKAAVCGAGCIILSLMYQRLQWYSLLSLPLLLLYSGKRGKYKMKSFFYWYYPLHLAVIYIFKTFII